MSSQSADRAERIDAAVTEWHNADIVESSLWEYLGWTRDEYTEWVQDPSKLPPEREGSY